MRKRVDQIGVAEPSLQRSGADQIDVSLPDVKNADEAASQVGTTAQMWFYDWEGSVLGPNCKPDPQNPNVTGGAGGRRRQHPAGAVALRRRHARRRSARAPTPARSPRATSSTWSTRSARRSWPAPTRAVADLQKEALNKKIPFDAKQVVKVPQGIGDRPRRAARPQGPAAAGLVRPRRPADPRRHGHQEPRAELRQRRRARAASRTSPSTSPARARACGRSSRASSPQRGQDVLARRPRRRVQPALRHHAGQRADLGPADRLAPVPRRPGRRPGVADLGRLHHRLGPAAGQPAQDRRPADQARAHLRVAGLRHAGQAGAQPGPHRRRRPASSSSRSSC